MDFLTQDDFISVCDSQTLSVINQNDTPTFERGVRYAIEEIKSYLSARYDMDQAFALTGAQRNDQLVMITCDIALYHLVAWLPKRIGFEIREIRYKNAIAWLKDVQAGKASPNLPPNTNDQGEDIGTPVRYGGWDKSKYDY